MKLRGARRKRLGAERITTRQFYPNALLAPKPDGTYEITLGIDVAVGIATHSLMLTRTTDGFGRSMKGTRDPTNPPRERAPRLADNGGRGDAQRREKFSWGASLKFESVDQDVLALIWGDRP